MEEKLKNLEPDLLALAEALRDMPLVYSVDITRVVYPYIHYEMRAIISEDPEGLMRDVPPKHSNFWHRKRDFGPCTLILINDDDEELAYRAKWGLEPMEEVRKDEI